MPEIEGGFTVTVPSLPGCITWGANIEEAKKMAYEAISLYLEDMEEKGEEIPNDIDSLELSLVVN
jgi:antitoxin HicB